MSPYDDVQVAWKTLSRDGHIGLSDAVRIVVAAANSGSGRRALAERLAGASNEILIDEDAFSYLRIGRDLPVPPGVQDNRADEYFRTRFYTGTRLSRTHHVETPRELLYFNFKVVMLTGTLDDVAGVREQMRGSGYDPVIARMWGSEKAIGIIMVNEFRDTTFGPYNEVIFMATVVPAASPESAKAVEYVNALSLQTPLDRGGTTYVFKLWLNELSAIDGGNDFLGTNKELGCFRFGDRSDGAREFRSWDRELKALVSGVVPGAISADAARAIEAAYRAAAASAGTDVPASSVTTIPVASRPDRDVGKPACKWSFAVDWRKTALAEVTPSQVGLRFGDAEWARRFGGFGFTPALSFYSPSGVGQIYRTAGGCPSISDGA